MEGTNHYKVYLRDSRQEFAKVGLYFPFISCCGFWGRESYFVCYCLLVIMWFLLERFPLPLGAWDGLRYFIVALPEPSI